MLCFLLIGCKIKRKNKTIFRPFKKKNNELYIAKIEGVECRQCAIAALKRLKKIDQLDYVECVCPRGQYEKASFECYIKKNKERSLPLKEIQQALKLDDFEMKTIEGTLEGTFTKDKKHFVPVLFDSAFLIKYSPYHLFPEEDHNIKKKTHTLAGILNFEEKTFYVN